MHRRPTLQAADVDGKGAGVGAEGTSRRLRPRQLCVRRALPQALAAARQLVDTLQQIPVMSLVHT